jgi:hypothetical protein
MPSPTATKITAYWSPSFVSALEIGLPNLETLCLCFKELIPNPPVQNWQTFEKQFKKGLPNLKNLYIVNGIARNTEYKPEGLLQKQTHISLWDTLDWKSLEILHVPWQVVFHTRSTLGSMNRGLKELVIDVMGDDVGPLRDYKWDMINEMANMRMMPSYTPQCHFIF